MAGQETTRDVIIRVALKQTTQLEAPSSSAFVQSQKKALDEVVQHRKSVVTPAMMAAINSEHIQAINNIDLRRKAEQEAANLIARDKLKEIQISEQIAAHERAKAAEAVQAASKVEAANIKAAQAARSLGESSLLAIRGFVMLSATGNKEVEKILHSLLAVQGVIDVYKGLSGVLIGIAQAYRAIAASATAAAVAQRASAVAGTGGAAGGILGGVGVSSALIGGGAALAAGGSVGLGLNRLLAKTGVITDYGWRGNKPNEDLIKENLAAADRREQSDLARRQMSRLFVNRSEVGLEGIATRAGVAGRQRAFDLSESDVAFGEASSALGMARSTAEVAAGQRGQADALTQRRALLASQGQGIAGEVAAATALRDAAIRQGHRVDRTEGTGTSTDIFEAKKAALEQQREAEKQIADAVSRQNQNRMQQLQTQRQSLELARDQLQAEKDRVNSVNRGLGSLNEGEIDEAKRIAQKVKAGGKVSREELTFLERSGSFGEFTQKEREKLGAEANKGGELDVLTGGKSRVNELEGEVAKLAAGEAESSRKIVDLLKDLGDDRKREAEALDRVVEASKNIGDLAVKIEQIADNMEAINRREQRRRQASQ